MGRRQNSVIRGVGQQAAIETKRVKNYRKIRRTFPRWRCLFLLFKRQLSGKRGIFVRYKRGVNCGIKVIQKDVHDLICQLDKIEKEYLKLSESERKKYYYRARDEYNQQQDTFDYENYNSDWIKRAAYLIFLNKTCFNGLFRQNKKGKFNVPFGRYKNPTICDKENLLKVHEALKCTHIFAADFEESKNFITKDTLVYFDPPYRPLNNTSNFTSYDKDGFTDEDQIRLSDFYKEMDKKGAFLLLSNSDPKNVDINDDFFDSLYADYKIERVNAKRFINCDGAKRGDITELLIRNYE